MLRHLSNRFFAGIHQTPSSISIIELQFKGTQRLLTRYHHQPDWEAATDSLQALWKQHQFRASRVAINVMDNAVVSQRIQIPQCQNPQELTAAISLEISQYTPLDIKHIAVDYFPVEPNHFFVCACEQLLVEQLCAQLRSAQLKPLCITLESMAWQYARSQTALPEPGPYANDKPQGSKQDSSQKEWKDGASAPSPLESPFATIELARGLEITQLQAHESRYTSALGLALIAQNLDNRRLLITKYLSSSWNPLNHLSRGPSE